MVGFSVGMVFQCKAKSQEAQMSTGEKDVLQKALAEISKLRQSMGEGRFRELLRELKASNRICSCASEMVRSFDEEGGTFLRPYRHILRLIGNDRIERSKFRRTIRTFEPGEKWRPERSEGRSCSRQETPAFRPEQFHSGRRRRPPPSLPSGRLLWGLRPLP